MTDEVNQFSTEDDDLLASVLLESLRHYNEVEVPLRTICVDPEPDPKSTSITKIADPPPLIDLCVSPKKNVTVQSRLSHFFRNSKNDKISKEEHQIDQQRHEINVSPVNNNDGISNTPAMFHKGPDADGFYLSSGSHYLYPSNFPVREYQMDIIKTALFHNTLVSLPTGMGKTFIAAVVMYNFYRWYPMGKIVFMAPTRPLVAQQIEACHSIMGIPKDVTFEMTGNIAPEQRYLAWKKYRVFFLTPQVMANDLNLNKCPSEMLKCIIIDEAHRATKDYAYVQVLKRLQEENRIIRIIGLSATPGTTTEAVIEVIQNLSISKLEFRTDESLDVAKYTNKKDVECISVKLTSSILNIRSSFLGIYDKYSRRLKQYRVLNGNISNLTKFQILGIKQKFQNSQMAREMPKPLVGCLISDFTVCMSLAYALELLTIYGVKVFYLQSMELLENHKCLSNDPDFQKMLQDINKQLNTQDLTWSHPKLFELKNIVQNYFGHNNTESNSKIIIFCQYRLVVVEVFELLKTFGSSVKPVMFVGQSMKEKGGLPQKKQLEVMNRFKSGDFNILIATSVAEEGLDIGEVDLIICLEANKSPIKFVQRLGRTGRKRSGKCVTLLTEGKEQMKYKSSVASSKTLVLKMLKNNTILNKLAKGGPRLIPKHINPKCLMIHVKQPEEPLLEDKKRKGKRKAEEKIMSYVINDNEINEDVVENEEGLDVFQNNNGKSKKKSKKRKIAQLQTNNDVIVEAPVSEQDADDRISDDFNVASSLADEINAFNEWKKSCEQTGAITMDDLFFKLLNLFTDPWENGTVEQTILFQEIRGVDRFVDDAKTSIICKPSTPIDIKHNMLVVEQNEFGRKLDSDVLLKSQRLGTVTNDVNERRENADLCFRTTAVGGDYDDDVHSVQLRNDVTVTKGGTKNKVTVIGRDDGDAADTCSTICIDLEDEFRNQRVDSAFSAKINSSFNGRNARPSTDPTNIIPPFDSVSARMAVQDDNDNDEQEEADFDFDELFKSQRADKYIKDYMEKITQRPSDQPCADNNHVVWPRDNVITTKGDTENDILTIGSDDDDAITQNANVLKHVSKSQRAVKVCSTKIDLFFSGCKVDDHVIDPAGTRPSTSRSVNVDQPPKIVRSTDGTFARVTLLDDDDDDDVIIISDSPTKSKETVQTKLTDHYHQRCSPDIVDITSSSPTIVAADQRLRSPVPGPSAVIRNGWISGHDWETAAVADDDDMDFMFVNYPDTGNSPADDEDLNEVFTQKLNAVDDLPNHISNDDDDYNEEHEPSVFGLLHQRQPFNSSVDAIAEPSGNRHDQAAKAVVRPTAVRSTKETVSSTKSTVPSTSNTIPLVQNIGLSSFNNNLLKACNLLKPGFSLKKSKTTATPATAAFKPSLADANRKVVIAANHRRIAGDVECMSPINPSRRSFGRNQSTPKVPNTRMTLAQTKVSPAERINTLLTSSSDNDSDIFANDRESNSIKNKKPKIKPKKKLLFIDDEADVSYCNMAATSITTRSSSDDDDSQEDNFDSSFIDDDKSDESSSMTNQYLQSVKSPPNARGIFKIPMLSTQHYNIDVYSQMDDRNDNSYIEDSFCVRDASDLNTSSNTSTHQTSEERSSRRRKRKRILSPKSSDSDSPDQFNRNTLRKRAKVKTSLDIS